MRPMQRKVDTKLTHLLKYLNAGRQLKVDNFSRYMWYLPYLGGFVNSEWKQERFIRA